MALVTYDESSSFAPAQLDGMPGTVFPTFLSQASLLSILLHSGFHTYFAWSSFLVHLHAAKWVTTESLQTSTHMRMFLKWLH